MNKKIINTLTDIAIANPGIRNNQFKFGAGIVYRNHIIATGVNSYKTHPLMAQWGQNEESICLHAEIDAIKNALKIITVDQLSKCDMYIVRVKRPEPNSTQWTHGLAKPCEGCQRAIVNFDLRNVFYTVDVDTFSGSELHNLYY
jgi:deoxycytidylate deaminase